MNANQIKTDRNYWLAWVLASAIGYCFGAILGSAVASNLFPLDRFYAANGITLGIVTGAVGGYFQWVVLRERITGAGLWWLPGALGLGLAIGVIITTGTGRNYPVAGLLMAAIFGVTSGVLQWLILRRKISLAGWWLLANILGTLVGATGFPIAGIIFDAGNWGLGLLTFGLLFGAGNGAITGAALIWLLRKSSSYDIEGLPTVH